MGEASIRVARLIVVMVVQTIAVVPVTEVSGVNTGSVTGTSADGLGATSVGTSFIAALGRIETYPGNCALRIAFSISGTASGQKLFAMCSSISASSSSHGMTMVF